MNKNRRNSFANHKTNTDFDFFHCFLKNKKKSWKFLEKFQNFLKFNKNCKEKLFDLKCFEDGFYSPSQNDKD